MEYISSDTNVWIDFSLIQRIRLPFLLPFTYIMYHEAIETELLDPPELKDELMRCGLVAASLAMEEFDLAEGFGSRYPRLSKYDRIALAIAKVREIPLLTGDGKLREAAMAEGVRVLGTLGILDQLLDRDCLPEAEYRQCLLALKQHPRTRMPAEEIDARLHGGKSPP